ncbi:LuxR C-terminal-related transcriptional regulator [Ralstonia sp. 21MJYT02-11]|uniref:LuxR C-terminal-related transcriptional regulator n=2 Tax=Ralstonia soli TaxID=2953896 RepID=A0ABT1AG94_9RALS|nr:LuxR C-terminal-related transcriptional regulator [Ralstonia soli]
MDALSELIGMVYEGVLIDIPWRTLLDALRHQFSATYVTLVLRPPTDGSAGLLVTSSAVDTTVGTGAYAQHFYALDPFVNLPRDEVVTVQELIGQQQWLESEIYRFFNKPYDVLHIMGADIRTDHGIECRLRVCRSHAAAPFSDADKALCKLLLPHLRRAVRIRDGLNTTESQRRLYEGTVDRLLIGSVALDESGNVLSTNSIAEALLAEQDGIALMNGRLVSDHSVENRKLQGLIQQAITSGTFGAAQPGIANGLSITRSPGRSKLGILVRAVSAVDWSGSKHRPAALVLIRDPDQKAVASAELLRSMFDFTRAEASLVLLLVEGLSLDEASQALDISRNTARAHLRTIFSKAGVTRQTALIQTIFNSVIPQH